MQGIDNDNDGRLKELVSVLRGAKEGFLTRGITEHWAVSSHLWSKKEVSSWKKLLLPLHPAGNPEARCIESNILNPPENWAVLKNEMIPNND